MSQSFDRPSNTGCGGSEWVSPPIVSDAVSCGSSGSSSGSTGSAL